MFWPQKKDQQKNEPNFLFYIQIVQKNISQINAT